MPSITFADVTLDDFERLVTIRIAAMRASLEAVGRFDPDRARERLRKSFFPEFTQIIIADSQSIGFYTLRPVEDGLHLDHFYIHPDWQSQGIGSQVLRSLLTKADAEQVAVHLGALRDSPSNRFYQRHGFTVTGEDEWDVYFVRNPAGRL